MCFRIEDDDEKLAARTRALHLGTAEQEDIFIDIFVVGEECEIEENSKCRVFAREEMQLI